MLCGRPPFEADAEAATALARLQRDPLRPRQVRPGRAQAARGDRRPGHGPRPRAALRVRRRPARRPARRRRRAQPRGRPHRPRTLAAAPVRRRPPPRRRRRPAAATAAAAAPSFRQTERSWLVPTILLVGGGRRARAWPGSLLGRSGAGDLVGGVKDAITGAPDPDAGHHHLGHGVRPTVRAQPVRRRPARGRRQREPGHRGAGHRRRPGHRLAHRGLQQPRTSPCSSPASASSSTLESAQRARRARSSTAPRTTGRPQIYVADADPGNLAGWGDPVATTDPRSTPGTSTIDLGGHRRAAPC